VASLAGSPAILAPLACDTAVENAAYNGSPLWSLDPAVTFLNHGSFGACPRPVLAKQQQLREALEREPVQFMVRQLEPLLDAARVQLAALVNAPSQDLVFVPNATTGVNTVLRSLSFQPGDQLLVTDHGYNACCNALEFVAQRTGADIMVAAVPFPLNSADQAIEAVLDVVTPRTRLALLDHVASPTALVFPIAHLVQELTARGVDTLVDGAHALGMVPIDLATIRPTYYTGNCHKHLCAPKGAAFLYIQPERQHEIRPLTISHGANSPRRDRARLLVEFDWTGTYDPTPYLCIPEALELMGNLLPGGWAALQAHNHRLIATAREQLCQILKCLHPCPVDMLGSMASIPVPESFPDQLSNVLFDQFQIEVPIIPWPVSPMLLQATQRSQAQRLLRISAQLYNTPQDYEKLAQALLEIRAEACIQVP
jgi:isopenicillin-N epimerase